MNRLLRPHSILLLATVILTLIAVLPVGAQGAGDAQDPPVTAAEVEPVGAADSLAPEGEEPLASPEPALPQKPAPPRPSMAPT